jgi:uncharacterized protein YjbJ (UPF0337 family)
MKVAGPSALKENKMNWDQVEGNWKQMKGAVKKQWGKLTEDDLTIAKGNAEALGGRLQERYGISKEQAKKEMDEFIKAHQTHTHA